MDSLLRCLFCLLNVDSKLDFHMKTETSTTIIMEIISDFKILFKDNESTDLKINLVVNDCRK